MTHCCISFKVKFFTELSESIRVLGNVDQLGNWNPSKAHELITTPETYPDWISPNPIRLPSGTKIQFKFAVFRDGHLTRWESLPNNANREYRARYNDVVLICSEGVEEHREDVRKKFVSSSSLEISGECKRVKKAQQVFNPFLNAQDSHSSDSWDDGSQERLSSDDMASGGAANSVGSDEGEMESPGKWREFSPKLIFDQKVHSSVKKDTFKEKKASELAKILQSGEDRPDVLSIIYHLLQTKTDVPKYRPTQLVNADNSEDNSYEVEDEIVGLTYEEKAIYACFKLPIRVQFVPNETIVEKKWQVSVEENSHLGSIYRLRKEKAKGMLWIGWIGTYVEEKEREELTNYLHKQYSCIPIFLEEDLVNKFLFEYCDKFLHEAFFNVIDMKTVFYQEDYIPIYNQVNEIFAQKIIQYSETSTLINIQDYHLMMVPRYLCSKNHRYSICYFFETPFPTLEVIKAINNKRDILQSLLCCDMICFNTSEQVKLFSSITAKFKNTTLSCERGGHIYIKSNGRKIYMRIGYPTIDPQYVLDYLSSDEYRTIRKPILDKYQGKILMLAMACFTKLEGIESLLEGIKAFFEADRNHAYSFCLVKVTDNYKFKHEDPEQQQYIKEIKDYVCKINQDLQSNGIVSQIEIYDELHSIGEKFAFLEMAKVLVAFSPHLENDLHILEYFFSRQKDVGTIVMSEFSHGHKHLHSLIKMNPFHKKEVVAALQEAINRKLDLQSYLVELDKSAIKGYTTWDRIQGLLYDLKRIQSIKTRLNLMKVDEGEEFKIIQVNPGFRALDSNDEVVRRFREAKTRLIICSCENTLSNQLESKQNGNDSATTLNIAPEDLEALKILTFVPNTHVFVISSYKVDVLSKSLEAIPNLTLLAENGFYYKMSKQGTWYNLFHCDWGWKTIVQRIMQNYATRTEGVKVENKDSSVIWNYENVKTEIAQVQEKELVNHLQMVLTQMENLEILRGDKKVEVKPVGINKGLACQLILEKFKFSLETASYPDFVLCVGETYKDEDMFNKIGALAKDNNDFPKSGIYTAVVGRRPSNAKFFLEGIHSLFDLFKKFAEESKN